jgi:hypothetical protein
MINIFCHTYNNDFSAQKPNILKKQPNVICLKLNFEKKPEKTQKTGFFGSFEKAMVFSSPHISISPKLKVPTYILFHIGSAGCVPFNLLL